MKYLGFFAVLLLSFSACKTDKPERTDTFKVWGNCEKCKKNIEAAATSEGILEKNWDVESKLMTVRFDTTKINLNTVEQLIAKAGYDNDLYYGDDYAYGKLEDCCQYERKPFELK
jgi:copper chaperone CopZ